MVVAENRAFKLDKYYSHFSFTWCHLWRWWTCQWNSGQFFWKHAHILFCTFVPASGGDFSRERRGVWSHLVLPPGLFSSPADSGVLQFANSDAWCLDDTYTVPTDLGQTMWKHRDLYRALRSRFQIQVKRKVGGNFGYTLCLHLPSNQPAGLVRTDDKDVKYKSVWFHPRCQVYLEMLGLASTRGLLLTVDNSRIKRNEDFGAMPPPRWGAVSRAVDKLGKKVLNVIFIEHFTRVLDNHWINNSSLHQHR